MVIAVKSSLYSQLSASQFSYSPVSHVEHDQRLEDRRQRAEVKTLVRASDVGIMVVVERVLVGTAVHHDQRALARDLLELRGVG